MTRSDIQPLREILQCAQRRYLNVRPHGFALNPGSPPRPLLETRILGFGGARTRYHNRKPLCRSLDGIRPISEGQRTCAECNLRSHCTSQVRLDLLADTQPFRLLLAHTSAKNFLLYETELHHRGVKLYEVLHRITVINRGSWGELRFSLPR